MDIEKIEKILIALNKHLEDIDDVKVTALLPVIQCNLLLHIYKKLEGSPLRTAMHDALQLDEETTLEALRPGAIFVTRDGCYAVKSEYFYPNGVCECVLLASGEYAHFKDGNRTLVREVRIAE